MKKVGKYIIFSFIVFLIGIINAFAKEYDLQTVGELVLQENPEAESFYVVGKYIFTMSYVEKNNLNTEDFMLAAHSINISETDKKVRGTEAYKKMSVYQILAHTDSYGDVTDWYVGANLIGENKINNATKFEVEYIDYNRLNNIYTVIFQDENGKELERHEIIEGHKAIRPNVDLKQNYQFLGWYNTEDDQLFDVDEENITKDITLKQKWGAKNVKIQFEEDIQEGEKEKIYTYPDITPNDLANVQPKPKEGYIFRYWYDSTTDDATAFDFTKKLELSQDELSKTITLKAKWEDALRINFKGQIDNQANDNFVLGKKTQLANALNQLTKEQIPTEEQEGYNFKGWFLQEDDKQIDLTNYKFSKLETTVIGKWETKVYTVKFDTDGGIKIGDAQVKHGEKVANPGNASKTSTDDYNGYEFIGWYKCDNNVCEDEEFNFDEETITSNITLKAKYQPVVYTNKMIQSFASEITSDNISAYVKEGSQLEIAILKKDQSLSENLKKVASALQKFIEVKNVESIQISGLPLTSGKVEEGLESIFKSLLSPTPFDKATLENLHQKSFIINFTLADGVKNEKNTNTDNYTAKFMTNFVFVSNEDELEKALSGNKEIIIKDWKGTISKPLNISRDVVIDGRNAEITSEISNSKSVFNITSGSVVIKDLTLKIDVLKPSEYDKVSGKAKVDKNTIGIEVGEGATLTANNFYVKNKETIDTKTLKISDEDLMASTVTINENAAILLKGTLYANNISYQDEIYGSPTVLATRDATMNVLGGNRQEYIYNITRKEDGTGEESKQVKDYIHYYKDYKNSRLIFVDYITMGRSYINIAYINNEQYFVPTSFKEDGSNYKYLNNATEKKYIFNNNWEYEGELESGKISTDELGKMKATLSSGDIDYYAQYDEIKAPVIEEFYLGDDPKTESTFSNTVSYHLSWKDDNVTQYCLVTEEDKSKCVWKDTQGKKEITEQLNFNSYNTYTYYAYLKNDEGVYSSVSKDTISYIKKDFTGKAEKLMEYEPKGLSKTLKSGMYRYSGIDVENYICFGTKDVDECLNQSDKYLFRIIGVTEGGKFKLMKAETFGQYQWNRRYTIESCGKNGDRCKYPVSDIYKVLNETYSNTLDKYWKLKIDVATWYYGSVTSDDKTGEAVYKKEIKEKIVRDKFGLMYLSDYYYAYNDGSGSENCQKIYCDSYLSTPYSEWTITRKDYDSTIYSAYIYYIHPGDKNARGFLADTWFNIRPVFYLGKNIEIRSGTGSKTRPFIIF